MTTAEQAPALDPATIEAIQSQAFGHYSGLMAMAMAHLGVKLRLYEALAGRQPSTSQELSEATGIRERFLREWLLQQAASGIVTFTATGTFALSQAAAAVYVDREHPASCVAMFEEFPEFVRLMLKAEDGFRSGLGYTYDACGDRVAHMVEAIFGAWNRSALVPEALPKVSGVVEKLTAGARVADLGCGGGSAPFAIARAFPKSRVDGYENSRHALALCEEGRAASAIANVRFLDVDKTPLPDAPTYDLVLTLDVLHDMPRPDLAAAAIRRAIKPDGVWLIADVDGAETPEANLSRPLGAAQFGNSIMLCLQSGASTPDGLALGTLGLPEPKMRELVRAAGFTRFQRVPGLEHPINAYYEVRP
jgi:SAM-dependent methyltransferase